ncbi:MAG: type IV toxin-antitoxin system AbiEi family antitoxin domain-containing protein [bacterium]
MKYNDFLKKLINNQYYVFSVRDLEILFPWESKYSIKKSLYLWKKKGLIKSLKRNLYELTFPDDYNIPDLFIANKLYQPSYISLETALSNFSIIPEISLAVTSMTTKPTRRFKNHHGLFTYQTVTSEKFGGYYIERINQFEIFIAEPEKALVDYVYFRIIREKLLTFKDTRIDLSVLEKMNKKKIIKYSTLYHKRKEICSIMKF